MEFSVLTNRSFRRIALMLRSPLVYWPNRSGVDANAWITALAHLVDDGNERAFLDVLEEMSEPVSRIGVPVIQVSDADAAWLHTVFEMPLAERTLVFGMLVATAYAAEMYTTPSEIARCTFRGSAREWSKRCKWLEDAVFTGKQWLVPIRSLYVRGWITADERDSLLHQATPLPPERMPVPPPLPPEVWPREDDAEE